MEGLALVDYDNFRRPDQNTKADIEFVTMKIVDRVVRTFVDLFPNAHELDIRLYGGWTDETGSPSLHATWMQELLPGFRGRRRGVIVRPALAKTMIQFPEFLLRGTVRGKNSRQKMVDSMIGCDAYFVTAQYSVSVGIITDDDDLLPVAKSAHETNPGMLIWMRKREVGSGINDKYLLNSGLRLCKLQGD